MIVYSDKCLDGEDSEQRKPCLDFTHTVVTVPVHKTVTEIFLYSVHRHALFSTEMADCRSTKQVHSVSVNNHK